MPQPSPSRTGYLEPATQDLIHHWILELEAQDVISGPQGRAAGSHQDLPDKGPDVQPISTETMTPKRTGKLGYERQPRYKTKEDRYEYKGSNGGNMCKKSSVKKIRSSKKARKHTINGNFHAPNVSRDRLTVSDNFELNTKAHADSTPSYVDAWTWDFSTEGKPRHP
ncbi:uncharacterized protein ACLA_036550 [Aspergillus clavatus NRRL 1]|uniref:Uncharacterized protein n=1 Tax=Aspergillus clavatus (strain ATCC 1007 / CBS 513.65 / DSM 816 / NCTC 3887 / NRRL 1 / QM 1276 / 107) TaxID=344612 RepID=A1CJX7_ASPCL|nr:uncharacterized protein ACLA_036550 [Aspergillus clavatus NRRL 1]EAW09451.1 hypothetical protein ACLA_036550 [Aspergillus clavatus NRRL 1]